MPVTCPIGREKTRAGQLVGARAHARKTMSVYAGVLCARGKVVHRYAYIHGGRASLGKSSGTRMAVRRRSRDACVYVVFRRFLL